MSKSLFVGGKEYMPSAEAAKLFGYTSDYISRLAREKRIVAACIDRRWFIEKDSLIAFLQQTDEEKKKRSEALKRQRKAEQMMRAEKKKEHISKQRKYVQTAAMQTVAVLMCGFFVGGLSWTISENDLSSSTLLEGSRQMFSDVAVAVTGGFDSIPNVSQWPDTLLSSVGQTNFLKTTADRSSAPKSVQSISNDKPQPLFSDEVIINYQQDGSMIIRPVRPDGSYGETYSFIEVSGGM